MEQQTLTDAIFTGVIVPNGISSDGHTLSLSICLEINPNNTWADSSDWRSNFQRWCSKVGEYLGDSSQKSRRGQLVAVALDSSNGFQCSGLDVTGATKLKVETTPNEIKPQVASLWRDFLSLDAAERIANSHDIIESLERAKPKPVSSMYIDLLSADFPPIAPSKSTLDISPELMLNDIRTSRTSPLQRIRSMNASEHADIRTAYDVHVKEIQNRCGFDKRPRSADPRERMSQTFADMNMIAKRFQLTPEYVRSAHSQLVSSPNLRRYFGTTIDFIVPLSKAPTAGQSFTVTLRLPDDLRAYFGIQDAAMCFASPVLGGPLVVLAAPATGSGYDDYFKNSVMVLGGHARVFSFDPQVAAKVADEVQEFVAALPDEQRVPTRKWSDSGSMEDRMADRKQLAVILRLNNQMANLPTIGQSIYLPQFRWTPPKSDPALPVREHEVVRGYVVYVRGLQGGNWGDWTSLTRVKEELFWRDAKDRDQNASEIFPLSDNGEIGIHVGGGVHSQDKEGGEISRIHDGFLFTWTGSGLSLRNPMIHYESKGVQSGGQELTNDLARLQQKIDSTNPEDTAIQLKNRKLFGVDWFPFKEFAEPPRLLVKRTFFESGGNEPKLFFGYQGYKYLVVAQYHNGYVPITEALLNWGHSTAEFATASSELTLDNMAESFEFLRQEHVKEVLISLEKDIYHDDAQQELKPEHPGESPVDLVVRTGELLSNDDCTRFILPSPIPSFQTYLWYSQADLQDRTMNLKDLAHWYRRYSCDARTSEEFVANLRKCEERNRILPGSGGKPHGCKARCTRFCGGVQQSTVWDGVLSYLPDPIVTGFNVEFFFDKECLLPAPNIGVGFCRYSKGRYPQWAPWRLVLYRLSQGNRKQSYAEQDDDACTIRVYLEEGAQLFLRIIPAYYDGHLAPSRVDERSIPFQQYGMEDLLYANAKILSLTHAVQRPLFDPVIQQIVIHRYNEEQLGTNGPEPANTIGVSVNLRMEHLNVHDGVAIPGTTPSGELELYALWDDFGEHGLDPVKSINDKRDPDSPSGGFVKLDGKVFESNLGDSSPQPMPRDGRRPREAMNYLTTVPFRAQSGTFSSTHFTDAVFKVRNGSKFHRYFHLEAPPPTAGEAHVRWSEEFRLSTRAPRVVHSDSSEVHALFLPNNRKPEAPLIRKIVPLGIDDRDRQDRERSVRGNRVRIYLEPDGRMHSGQEERVAVVVHEEYGIYNGQLADFKSKAGRDIVTDCTMPAADPALHGDQLTAHEFGVKSGGLEAEYLASFKPEYDREAFGDTAAIGLVSYVPQFDTQQGLWYFDPEIRIRNRRGQELHNAFVQLGLVSYQPMSANYNANLEDTLQGYNKDLRVSAPVKADFFSVYPGRDFAAPYVLFGGRDRRRFSVAGSVSSLFFQKVGSSYYLASQFILVVQEKDFGGFWTNMDSRLTSLEFLLDGATIAERDGQSNGSPSPEPSGPYHCLLPWDLGDYLRDEEFVASRFECALRLEFEPGFLRTRRGGHYRVLVYEVDWFNYEQQMNIIVDSLRTVDPTQIPGLRSKPPIFFY